MKRRPHANRQLWIGIKPLCEIDDEIAKIRRKRKYRTSPALNWTAPKRPNSRPTA